MRRSESRMDDLRMWRGEVGTREFDVDLDFSPQLLIFYQSTIDTDASLSPAQGLNILSKKVSIC